MYKLATRVVCIHTQTLVTGEMLLLKLYLEHNSGLKYYVGIILPCYVDCSCEALWVGSCLAECHLHTGTSVREFSLCTEIRMYLCQFDEQ